MHGCLISTSMKKIYIPLRTTLIKTKCLVNKGQVECHFRWLWTSEKPAEDRSLWNKEPNGTMEARELLSQRNTSRRSQISEVKWPWSRSANAESKHPATLFNIMLNHTQLQGVPNLPVHLHERRLLMTSKNSTLLQCYQNSVGNK